MSRPAFLKAIHADPDDDTVRLAFADWLEEHDDPTRAEFIRVQVELARTEPWTERGVDLSIRERELLLEHRRAWLDEVPKWVPRKDARFARGLPAGITCTATKYLEIADRLAATVVQELDLSQFTAGVAFTAAATTHLARVRRLHVRDDSWSHIPILLASRHLAGLRDLSLAGGRGGVGYLAESLRALAGSAMLGSLERLSVTVGQWWYNDPPLPPEVFLAMVALSTPRLRSLRLEVPDLERGPLGEVLASPVVARLAELRLPNYLPAAAVRAFRDAPELPALRTVGFGSNYGTASDFAAAFDSPALRHVVALDSRQACPALTLGALAALPLAGRLRKLASIGVWHGSGAFRELLDLRIDGGNDEGVRNLAGLEGLEKLRHLDLSGTAITPVALDSLAAGKNLPNLRAVTVSTALGPGNLDKPAVMRSFAAKYADRFAVLVWA